MITEDVDIMALVDLVKHTGQAAESAHHESLRAYAVARKAEEQSAKANVAAKNAQNALVVAAGGTDTSFLWAQVAQK